MSGLHFHSLRVSHVAADTDDARVISFQVPPELAAAFAFTPGQYLTLRAVINGQELRRSYSICAAPGEAPRVGVRLVSGGAFSSWLHNSLQAGHRIDVMEPQGRFGQALSNVPQHVLAVAGGSGITPLLSILKAALAADESTRCTLLYGNRSTASTMFKEELEDLKNRYLKRLVLHPVFSREAVDSPLATGRLDAEKIHTLLRLIGPVDQAFICGPHAMNDEAQAALLSYGVPPERVHVERFGIPPAAQNGAADEPQAGDASTATISILRDGVTRDVPFGPQDHNILAAAARAGLDVPYSCKTGVCATCRCKLQAGQVRMGRNFALLPDELAAGFVLACQAHPLTPEVRVSFDER